MDKKYIQPKEQIHYSYPVSKDHPIVETIKQEKGISNLTNKHNLDFDNVSLHMYKGIIGCAIVIPVETENEDTQKNVAVYFTETNEIKNIKVMTLSYKGTDNFSLTFANVDESVSVTGIFKDDNHVETKVSNTNKAQVSGFVDCLEREFNSLPYALRAVCFGACAAIGTGVGAAACAGCLVGLGIDC